MHGRADADETFERYVMNGLGDEERRSLEEHLIECSECFERVQEMERFVAGVRDSAAEGLLDPKPITWSPWLVPVFAGLLVLASGFSIWNLTRSLHDVTAQRDALAHQLQQANNAAIATPELLASNLPLVILQASRASNEQVLAVNSSAREVALWIEIGPQKSLYTVEISTDKDQQIEQAVQLKANRYGALAMILPASKVPPGHYIVRLFSQEPRNLLGQYLLRIISE